MREERPLAQAAEGRLEATVEGDPRRRIEPGEQTCLCGIRCRRLLDQARQPCGGRGLRVGEVGTGRRRDDQRVDSSGCDELLGAAIGGSVGGHDPAAAGVEVGDCRETRSFDTRDRREPAALRDSPAADEADPDRKRGHGSSPRGLSFVSTIWFVRSGRDRDAYVLELFPEPCPLHELADAGIGD